MNSFLFSIIFTILCANPNFDTINPQSYPQEVMEQQASDIEYLAQCIEAEAGNQSYMGKVYVLDCILNRMDYYQYDSYSDCINDKGQFACVSNGSIYNMIPSDETYAIIEQELQSRTDYDIMYFRTAHYHTFGTPKFKCEDHYFSMR